MYKLKNILAIVPARSGSKEIKNKNLKKISKISLVGRAVLFAKKNKEIDDVVVSTDGLNIKKEVLKYKIKVPFMRPKKLSGDRIPDYPVLYDSLINAEKFYKKKYEYIVMLQPTSPLRTKKEFQECIKKIYKDKFDTVWTIREIDKKYHPFKQFLIKNKNVYLHNKIGKKIINRQELKKTYIRNGAIYIFSRNCILKQKTIFGKRHGFYISQAKHISIDTLADLKEVKKRFYQNV